jgi:hypothetical protein
MMNERMTAAEHLVGCTMTDADLMSALTCDEACAMWEAAKEPNERFRQAVLLECDGNRDRIIMHFRECVRRLRLDAGLDKPCESSALQRLVQARAEAGGAK